MTVKVTEVKQEPIKRWIEQQCPRCEATHHKQVPISGPRTMDVTCRNCGAVYTITWEPEDETD